MIWTGPAAKITWFGAQFGQEHQQNGGLMGFNQQNGGFNGIYPAW